jgi:type VI secretion system secreted protein VgrG
VLVEFAGGDPDKPVIVGQLYNAVALTPAFRHEDPLPATRYQSGLRSREVQGRRGNQLRLDDTPGQISAQLASDHATTELNLGYLTELRQDGRAAPRGEGAELRTDEAIALHAAKGIFLSAWKLLGAATSKGSQLERGEFLGLMRECGELFASLGNYAAAHNGLEIDPKDQDELLARFKRWEEGSNTAPEAAEPREPVIGITSPAGIGFASSRAIVSYSARNIDTVAQQHLQLAAGQRFAVNAGKGVSFFAQHGGLNAIAHFGKLVLQSQHDDTAIDSARNMQLTACDGVVTVSAKSLHFVVEDGSFVRMGNGEFVIGSKHPIQFHAPDYLYDGPETMTPLRPTFSNSGADQKAELRYPRAATADETLAQSGIVKDAAMNISLSDGSNTKTRSGADGKSELLARDAMHLADIDLLRGGAK